MFLSNKCQKSNSNMKFFLGSLSLPTSSWNSVLGINPRREAEKGEEVPYLILLSHCWILSCSPEFKQRFNSFYLGNRTRHISIKLIFLTGNPHFTTTIGIRISILCGRKASHHVTRPDFTAIFTAAIKWITAFINQITWPLSESSFLNWSCLLEKSQIANVRPKDAAISGKCELVAKHLNCVHMTVEVVWWL